MDYLNWELSVLQRAVVYPNLSSAAGHIGISQPQLSRILSRLEKELNIELLDRQSKRKSKWSAHSKKLAEIYAANFKQFQNDVRKLTEESSLHQLHIGALEGLISLVLPFSRKAVADLKLQSLQIEVEDISILENNFLRGGYELLFTMREPSKRKYDFVEKIGYQHMDTLKKSDDYRVLSPFEFATSGIRKKIQNEEKTPPLIISNSLAVRRRWLTEFGGHGDLPSDVQSGKSKREDTPVWLIGAPHLSQVMWKRFCEIISACAASSPASHWG